MEIFKKFKPSFIIAEEGGYDGIFANISDAKQFLEG